MSYSHHDHPTGGLAPAYIGPHKIPDIGETRCYWALLSSNLQFLYMDPVLVYHLQDQARTLYGKSLLMFIHPDDRRVAEGDLRDCLSDTVQHGSVTRVRFQRLSRVRRELGHEHQHTPWSEASKIALDPNYMAVDIVINWAADGLVLCFMHAVKDLTPSDNDKYNKTPWTNWCGNVGLDDTRLGELVSRLERCAPEMPPSSVEGIAKVFQILRNDPSNPHMPDRGLLITWPPDSPALHHHHSRRGYGQVATARDLAGISNEMQAGLAADTDARTNCTKRTQTTRDLPLGRVESVLVGYGPILFACHKIIMHHVPSSSSMSSSSSSSSPQSYAPPSATYGAPQPPPPPLPPPSEHALVLPPPHSYHHDEAPPLHGSGGSGGGGHHQAHHSRGYTTGPGVMTPPTQARHPSDYPVPLSWHHHHQQQQQQHSEAPPPSQSQSRFSNQGQAPWAAAAPPGAGYSSSQSQHVRSFRASIGVNMYGGAGSESAGTNAMVTDDSVPSAPGPTSHHSAAAGAGVPYERGLQQQQQQHPHRYQNRPSDEQSPHHHHHHHHHYHHQQLQYSSMQAPLAVPTLPPPSALAPLPPSTSLPLVHTQNQTRKRSPASPTLDGPGVPTSRRRTDSDGGYGASAASQPTSSGSPPGASGAGNVVGQVSEAPPPLPSRGGSGGTSSGGTNDGGSGGRTVSGMQCAHCKTTSSPEWRKGPSGKKELCNACGLRFARSKAKSNGATAQNGAGKKRKTAAGGGGGMSSSVPPPPAPTPSLTSGVAIKQDPSLDLPLPAPSLLHHHHQQQQQQQGLASSLPPLDNPHAIHLHHQQPQPQHNHQQVRRRGSSFYSNEDSAPAYVAGSAATSSSSYLPSPHEYHHQPQHHQHPSHTRHSLSPRLLPPPPSVPSSAPSEHYYYALPPPSHHQYPQHHREYSGYRLDGEGEGTQYHDTPLSTSYERESRSGSGGSEREDGRLSASA